MALDRTASSRPCRECGETFGHTNTCVVAKDHRQAALDHGFLVRLDQQLHRDLMSHTKKVKARSAAGVIRKAVKAYLNGDCADPTESG